MRPQQDTIAAIATPTGEGSVAMIRVSGSAAHDIAQRIFAPLRGDNPKTYAGYTTRYGQVCDPNTGEFLDEAILTLFRAPRSYTGEDCIEIACHGGRASTLRVLQAALDSSARLAEPGEFTLRAFLNGRIDLAQAEAVADLIRARTESARRLAKSQLQGTLSQAIAALKDQTLGMIAAVEVTIDFSDEVGDLDYDALLAEIQRVIQSVQSLLQTAKQGRILREGARVAIAGRPNAGKSSLLNALLKAERAIVTPIAGTTRDLVEESLQIQGIPIALIDTAGIRETQDAVEKIGVERAQSAIETADVALLMIDVAQGFTPEDAQILARLTSVPNRPVLVLLNKIDRADKKIVTETERQIQEAITSPIPIVPISAQTRQGIENLERSLVAALWSDQTETSGWHEATLSNARHQEALAHAQESLRQALQTAQDHLPADFIAIDLRGALDSFGLITGETVTEEIIHRIFHDFCVGK